jgi:hypothetical protein
LIPSNMHLFVEQTEVIVDKISCQTTSITSTVHILVPPTLNEVTAYTSNAPQDDDVVFLAADSGLDFGVKYYPLIGQHLSLIGAHFPQSLMPGGGMAPFPSLAGPVLAPSTVVSTSGSYYGPGPSSVDNSYQYALGYLDTLTSSAGNYDQRHLLPAVASSYVYAPRPTLVELFVMLNAALAAQTTSATNVSGTITAASNAAPVIVTSLAPHGLHNFDQVRVADVQGNSSANGSWFVTVLSPTTFSLNQSSGSGAYTGGGTFVCVRVLTTLVQLGFDDANNTIIAIGPSRVLMDTRNERRSVSFRFPNPPLGASSLSSYLGFGVSRLDPPARASVPTFILRTVQIRPGNYDSSELVDMMNVRMNPLLFDELDDASRTLTYLLPGGGAPATVVIPRGRYTGVQLAAYLNFYLSQPLANIAVTFNDVSGRFTFAQQLGLTISLMFAVVANHGLMARRLGFEPVNYSGASQYTSVNQAVFGVTSSQSYPSNTYFMSADHTQRHFTFDTGDAVTFKTTAGVNTNGVDSVWEPVYECSTVAAGFASTLTTSDVLFAQAPYLSGALNLVTSTLGALVAVTTAANHGLTSGDSVILACIDGLVGVNGSWTVTVTGLTTFTLDGSIPVAGNGIYVAGTGIFYSTSVLGVSSNTYTVVVKQAWDASGGTGLPAGTTPATLTLLPTVSVFSTLDAATLNASLGTPAVNHPVYLQDSARSVFQLFFGHPDARASNFGFPAIAWPPYSSTLQLFDTTAFPAYNPLTRSVPVASSYTSPYCYNLLPPDYIIMLLCNPTGSKDMQTHTFGKTTKPIFAKLYITSPYLQISEQMLHSTFAGFQRVNSISVEFQNPDGSLVEFNGRPHSFSLLFTLYENSSETTCF